MGLYSNYIFPRLLDWSLGTRIVEKERAQALAPARGSALEIGFGTGLNLPHYPRQVSKLTVIDSERMLRDRVERRIRGAPVPVEQMQFDACERLPFGDDSFDTVVTTFTLCTIADFRAALSEINRVLKPGGSYLFLEHGRSGDPRVAKRQDLFNPIQRFIARGCNVNRLIDRMIKDAGFEIVTLDRFLMPETPRIFAEMYRGVARK